MRRPRTPRWKIVFHSVACSPRHAYTRPLFGGAVETYRVEEANRREDALHILHALLGSAITPVYRQSLDGWFADCQFLSTPQKNRTILSELGAVRDDDASGADGTKAEAEARSARARATHFMINK